jgi:hypothetical protein
MGYEQIRMEDLLQAQFDNEQNLLLFEGMASFSINMLIHQINKSKSSQVRYGARLIIQNFTLDETRTFSGLDEGYSVSAGLCILVYLDLSMHAHALSLDHRMMVMMPQIIWCPTRHNSFDFPRQLDGIYLFCCIIHHSCLVYSIPTLFLFV